MHCAVFSALIKTNYGLLILLNSYIYIIGRNHWDKEKVIVCILQKTSCPNVTQTQNRKAYTYTLHHQRLI